MFYLYLEIKFYITKKLIPGLIWVTNNFLRMECYRIICNKFYWKLYNHKIEKGTFRYSTRLWMIIITSLSALLLAFYFEPTDPSNQRTAAFIIFILAYIIKKSGTSLYGLITTQESIQSGYNKYIAIHISLSGNISLSQSGETYLKTSALLI